MTAGEKLLAVEQIRQTIRCVTRCAIRVT